ncbi:MAG TPA: hypothetical protein VN519_00445 [Bryobacteraceae bacterium]|nr:hypothetical protein [Bryobacteraceae bacterium]
MPTATPSSSANYSPQPCQRCGEKELQRRTRTLGHKLFGIYPYVCIHCANRENKFRLKPGLILRAVFLILVPGAIAWFWTHPFSFHPGDENAASGSNADALARARTTAGGLSTFEQMMVKKPRTTMDNQTILKLWKANVGTNVILQMIRTSNSDYDVSASAIIDLKQAGVDQAIILAMIDASYASR